VKAVVYALIDVCRVFDVGIFEGLFVFRPAGVDALVESGVMK